MLRLYWHCSNLDESQRDFLKSVFDEFSQLLKRAPVLLEAKIRSLPEDIAKKLEKQLPHPPFQSCKPFSDWFDVVGPKLGELTHWAPLLLCSQQNGDIAKAAQHESPLACWGYYLNESIATVYRPDNKYIIWHEALHLWGADDCYSYDNPHGPTTCELKNCIMQYAPKQQNVGDRLFLCERNVDCIRKYSAEPPF